MSFETTAELSISVADSELRSARAEIEDALSDVSVGLNVGASGLPERSPPQRADGGAGGATRAISELVALAQDRNEHLGTIRDILVRAASGGFGSTTAEPADVSASDIGSDINPVVSLPSRLRNVLPAGRDDQPELPTADPPALPGPPIVTDGGLLTDGGGGSAVSPQRERRRKRRSFRFERQRTENLDDIEDILDSADLSGGGGGGGGGGLLAGGGGLLSGALGGLLGGGLLGGGGSAVARLLGGAGGLFGGVLAAGAASGLGLREIFQDFTLETPESLPSLDREDIFGGLSDLQESINNLVPDTIAAGVTTPLAEVISDRLPQIDAGEIVGDISGATVGAVPDTIAVGVTTPVAGVISDRLPQIGAGEIVGDISDAIGSAVPGDINISLITPVAEIVADRLPTLDLGEIIGDLSGAINGLIPDIDLSGKILEIIEVPDFGGQNISGNAAGQDRSRNAGGPPAATRAERQQANELRAPADARPRSPGPDQVQANLNNQQQITVNVESELERLTDETAATVEQEVAAVREDLQASINELQSEIAGIRRSGAGRRGI